MLRILIIKTPTDAAFFFFFFLQGHGFITSKIVRVIKTSIDEVVDVKKDGLEIGEIVFTGFFFFFLPLSDLSRSSS